jgi:hypothetical protein
VDPAERARQVDAFVDAFVFLSDSEREQALNCWTWSLPRSIPLLVQAVCSGQLVGVALERARVWFASLGEAGIAELCEHWAEAPEFVAATLLGLGDEGVPALMEALTSESEEVRSHAILALGKAAPESTSAQFVLEVAERREDSPIVREALQIAREQQSERASERARERAKQELARSSAARSKESRESSASDEGPSSAS